MSSDADDDGECEHGGEVVELGFSVANLMRNETGARRVPFGRRGVAKQSLQVLP